MKKFQKPLTLLLSLCMASSLPTVTAFAQGTSLSLGTIPPNGVTANQPFSKGTAGSANFRIPAMVTLDDGTIVTACDARYNTTGDGGGLDTLVSYSNDNGKTWHHTMANYLGDNGNVWNKESTCFIDPVLATDGETVYMMVDLWPAGYALNSAKSAPPADPGASFNENGALLLSNNGGSTYDFYLEEGSIFSTDGSKVEGYTVDPYFNLYQEGGYLSNLFFGDSPYKVVPTDYLYLTSSKDGGATWSEPDLIHLRQNHEQSYLVGPGSGIVTEDGTIMFPCYVYDSGYQRTSLIYSTDRGRTWNRTEDATSDDWSSESALVSIDNTTVRNFYRDGQSTLRYTDYTCSNGTWNAGTPVDTGVSKTYNNQLSAIPYSQLIDGKSAILVSTADGGQNNRKNGKIYVFTLDDDYTMDLAYEFSVTPGSYSYSCLTELKDGSIGLLYENAGGSILYESFALDTILDKGTEGSIMAQLGHDKNYSDAKIELDSCLYTFTANENDTYTISTQTSDKQTVCLQPYSSTNGYPNMTTATDVSLSTSDVEDSFYLYGNNGYLYFWHDGKNYYDRNKTIRETMADQQGCSFLLYRPASEEETSSEELPGYIRVTDTDEITDGGQYLILSLYNDTYYALYPTTNTATRYSQIAKVLR